MLSGDLPEPRRHAYLAVLGVPLFLARTAQPGAAPGRVPELAQLPDDTAAGAARDAVTEVPGIPAGVPVDAPRHDLSVAPPAYAPETPPHHAAFGDEPGEAAGAPVASGAAREGLRAAGAVIQPATPRPLASAPPEREPVPVAPIAASADEPRFACRLLRVTASQAVLLDLGEYPDLGPQEQALWEAVCRAFGWQPETLSADFSWPLGQGRSGVIGRDSESARGVMQGWLARDLGEDMRLLVLGEPLAAFVQRPHRQLPALAALLASPLAKRTLWRQLAGDV